MVLQNQREMSDGGNYIGALNSLIVLCGGKVF
jgi:hypothetical protein